MIRLGANVNDLTHISIQGMGRPLVEENRSVAGSMVKESRPPFAPFPESC